MGPFGDALEQVLVVDQGAICPEGDVVATDFLEVMSDFFARHPAVHLDAVDWQQRLVGGRPAA